MSTAETKVVSPTAGMVVSLELWYPPGTAHVPPVPGPNHVALLFQSVVVPETETSTPDPCEVPMVVSSRLALMTSIVAGSGSPVKLNAISEEAR